MTAAPSHTLQARLPPGPRLAGVASLCALALAACQTPSPTIPDHVEVNPHAWASASEAASVFDDAAWQSASLQEPTPGPSNTPAIITVDNNGDGFQRADYVLMGIDCFGLRSGEVCDELGAHAGLQPGQALPMGWTGHGAAERIRDAGRYAWVSLSPHFSADGLAWVTVDVVTHEERSRLLVNSPPAETTVISNNLLQVYGSFANLRVQLLRTGAAPAFHIQGDTWEPDEPRLAAFAALFRAEVPKHRDELIKVLLRDREPTRRRAAAGLLGYDARDDATADALEIALLDADSNVRQEAASALTPRLHRAATAGEGLISVDPVTRMLHLPTATDRNAAATLLAELALVPALRPDIRQKAAPTLLQMLRSSRNNVVDQAITVLERSSGQSWGDDPERWAEALSSEATPAPPR